MLWSCDADFLLAKASCSILYCMYMYSMYNTGNIYYDGQNAAEEWGMFCPQNITGHIVYSELELHIMYMYMYNCTIVQLYTL